MASADDYAKWIVDNADKKGTPEFETVAKAYEAAKSEVHNGAKPYDTSTFAKRAMSFGQGLTFGFGDEIAGLVADKDRYRATLDQYRSEEPIGSGVSNVVGGLVVPAIASAPKLLKYAPGVLNLLNKSPMLTAGGTGLLYGGLQAAGDSESGSGIGGEALKGGGIGAGLGLAMMGSMKAVSPVAGAIANNAITKMPGIGDKYGIDLARRRVAQAFDRDNLTIADVGRNMRRLGAEARFADAAGENTRGTLDLNANLPGRTKDDLENLIRNRQATRPDRMDDVVYAVNGGYGRGANLSDALAEQKKEVAGPLYDSLHKMTVTPNERLVGILKSAGELGAFAEGKKSAIARQQPFTLTNAEVERMVQTGFDPLTNTTKTKLVGGRPLAMSDLDHVKRGLDTLIEAQTDKVTGKVTSLGTDYLKLKQKLVNELDTLVPEYSAARNAYAGPSALQTAITKGKAFWNEDAESLGRMMEGMSASEQEAFRVGASDRLREMVGTQMGQNKLLNLWKDRTTREKMQALLGDDVKFSQVEKFLKNEETLKRLESLGPGRNSRTFSREAASDQQNVDNAADLISAGVNMKTGGLWSLLSAASKNLATRAATPEPVRNGIGSILMSKYSTDEMKALELAMKAIKDRQRAAAIATGSAGGKAGGLLSD